MGASPIDLAVVTCYYNQSRHYANWTVCLPNEPSPGGMIFQRMARWRPCCCSISLRNRLLCITESYWALTAALAARMRVLKLLFSKALYPNGNAFLDHSMVYVSSLTGALQVQWS
jgi:hypothetical protein